MKTPLAFLFTSALACAPVQIGTVTASANPTRALVGQPVAFNCGATGGKAPAFHWEFGDGATSQVSAPTHIYERAGSYTATCSVTDAERGSQSANVTVQVDEDTVPQVEAVATPASGFAPLNVQFRSEVLGGNPPLKFSWDLGDETSASEAEPAHTYAAAGTFSVKLTVSDADGDEARARLSVSVGDAGTPAVTVTPISATGPAPLRVAFTCSAQGGNPPYRYAWSFGDGVVVSAKDTAYTYTRIGKYTAACTVTDRLDQIGQTTSEIDAQDPDRPPVIEGIVAANGQPGTEPLCAVAGQTEIRLAAAVHDGNDPPAGLRFAWTFEEIPFGSRAAFTRDEIPETAFRTDLVGDYLVRFWANNDRGKTATAKVEVKAEAMSRARFLNAEPATPGDAGAAYPDPLRVLTETACGLRAAGSAVRLAATNARVIEADAFSGADGVVTASLAIGCNAQAPATVAALPLERVRVEFRKENYGPQVDCVEPDVCLTRASTGPVYNRGTGATEWACGHCGDETTDYSSDFHALKDSCAGGSLRYLPGRWTCLHVVESDAHWDVYWTDWTANKAGGGFSYVRERTVPLPLEGPGAAVADSYLIAVRPGPAAMLRFDAAREVPVLDAAGAAVGMDVAATVSDACGNARTAPDVTFDLAVGHPLVEVAFTHSNDGGEVDCIEGEADVCLTRGTTGPVHNQGSAAVEWACGACGAETSDYASDLRDLRDACLDGALGNLPGRTTCLRMPGSGATWDIRWTSWQEGSGNEGGGGGGFAYVRSGIPPGNAGACFDALCPDDGGTGTPEKSGVTTAGGTVTLRVYSARAGWVGFAASDVGGNLDSAGGWTVSRNRVIDFEGDAGGFFPGAEGEYPADWQWGKPVAGAHTGTRAWATALAGDYAAPAGSTEEARWLTGKFAVPCPDDESAPVRLSFWESHEIAAGAVGYVAADSALAPPLASADGTALYDGFAGGREGWQGTSGWRKVLLDLSAQRCEETDLFFTLYLKGATQTGDGLSIDDVSLEYFGPRPNANFVGGPVHDGEVTAVRGGIASCATSPAVVRLAAEDRAGNAAWKSPAQLTATGLAGARIAGAAPGRLVGAPGAAAAVNVELLGWTNVEILADAVGTATATFKAPAGDRTADVDFVAASTSEAGDCEDGIDNDCDGKPDCADEECAQVLACRCLDGTSLSRAARSCLRIKDECGNTPSGNRWIDADGPGPAQPVEAYCDMTADGGGYTYFPISGGTNTCRQNDANSCRALGMDIVMPRSKAHWLSMFNKYGSSYFDIIPGIYRVGGQGNYTGCIMRNPASYGSGCPDWRVGDGGRWWIRDTTFGEPNGDYGDYCWLGINTAGYSIDANSINNGQGFNDGSCSYCTSTYICSTNDK